MTTQSVPVQASNRAVAAGNESSNTPVEKAPVFTAEQRQAIILENYPLVKAVACKIYHRLPKVVELDDLISSGVTGLIEALDRYDPSRAVPFPLYAKPRIQGAILDALRHQDWVPRSVRRKAELINSTRRSLRTQLGRVPNRQEMADAIEVTGRKYDTMVRDAEIKPLLSLDAPVGNENPTPLIEQVSGGPDAMERWQREELKEVVLQNLNRLPERERTAVSLYYLHELSLKEVGKVLGVTESRACQLCSQGVKRMRFKMASYHN